MAINKHNYTVLICIDKDEEEAALCDIEDRWAQNPKLDIVSCRPQKGTILKSNLRTQIQHCNIIFFELASTNYFAFSNDVYELFLNKIIPFET